MKSKTSYKRGNDSKTNTVIKTPIFGSRFKDETGKKYGRLTIIKYLGVNNVRHAVWECLCDCGNTLNSSVNSFRQGNKLSCGCITIERIKKDSVLYGLKRRLTTKEIGLNSIYSQYKCGAKQRNIEFKLTKEEFDIFINNNCFYCNAELSNKMDMLLDRIFKYNGIDRVNSDIGYIKENCVSSCIQCNNAKLDYTQNEFKEWIIKVYKNFID